MCTLRPRSSQWTRSFEAECDQPCAPGSCLEHSTYSLYGSTKGLTCEPGQLLPDSLLCRYYRSHLRAGAALEGVVLEAVHSVEGQRACSPQRGVGLAQTGAL
jgi:hypothetical protein